MAEAPRSNRPTPRTAAAVEAELRRRVRAELLEARNAADGELDDTSLASIIARAVALALGWHLEAPEHTRNATLSSRTWRPAGGPRGGARAPREDFEDTDERPRRGPREFDKGGFPRRGPDFGDRRPPRSGRDFEDGGFSRGGGFSDRRPPRSGRDFEDDSGFQPRRGARGGSGRPPGRGGGFGPRRPRPR